MDILFLCHRIPYPPDKGDKIRSFHLLDHLAARHRVRLVAAADDPGDLRHATALESAEIPNSNGVIIASIFLDYEYMVFFIDPEIYIGVRICRLNHF